MKCDLCNQDFCVCGDYYKKLSDDDLKNLIFLASTELKNRNKQVNCSIDNINIFDLNAPLIEVQNDGKVLTELSKKYSIPSCYKERLIKFKDLSAAEIIRKLDEDNNIVGSPLIYIIYKTFGLSPIIYDKAICSFFLSYLEHPVISKTIDVIQKAKTLLDIEQALYHAAMHFQAVLRPLHQNKSDMHTNLHIKQMLRCIQNIIRETNCTTINSSHCSSQILYTFMAMLECHQYNKPIVTEQIAESKFTESDEYYSLDAAIKQILINA